MYIISLNLKIIYLSKVLIKKAQVYISLNSVRNHFPIQLLEG